MFTLFLTTIFIAGAAGVFTNADLDRTLAKRCSRRSKCIIYLWSPNMPLSIHGLPEARMFARKKGLHLLLLVDDGSDPKMAAKVAAEQNFPQEALIRLGADRLIRLGAHVHYPSYVFASHGKISSPLVPGYRSTEALNKLTATFLR